LLRVDFMFDALYVFVHVPISLAYPCAYFSSIQAYTVVLNHPQALCIHRINNVLFNRNPINETTARRNSTK
jgi:hypothetical protein